MLEKEGFGNKDLFEKLCETLDIFSELKSYITEKESSQLNQLLKFCDDHRLLKQEILTLLNSRFMDRFEEIDIDNSNQCQQLKDELLENLFTIIQKRAEEKNLLLQVNEILEIKTKTANEIKEELKVKFENDENFIKYFLFFNSSNIDQGNNAYIFKLDITNFNDLSPSILLKLLEENLLEQEEYDNIVNNAEVNYEWITKLLKIGVRSSLEHEFGMQKNIYNIFNQQGDENVPHTNIAKPRGFYTLELIPEIKEFLRVKGFSEIDKLNELHFLIIDFAPGKDFARTLYETVINEHSQQNISFDMPFSILQKEVAEILGIKMLLSDNPQLLWDFKESLYEKAISYLVKHGYRLDPRLKPMLQRSIKFLHENGVTLNDAHLRNFVVEGNIWMPKNISRQDFDISQPPEFKIWIIDFGRAEKSENPINDSDYMPRDGYMNDFYIIDRLKQLLT